MPTSVVDGPDTERIAPPRAFHWARNAFVELGVATDMSEGHTISITPANAHVEVRLGDEVLATSDRAMQLDETGLLPRYYLPEADVRMDLLRPTSFHTTCPFKGEASYWSADIGGETHDGVVWAYPEPTPNATDIAGLMSFYPDRTEITVTPTAA